MRDLSASLVEYLQPQLPTTWTFEEAKRANRNAFDLNQNVFLCGLISSVGAIISTYRLLRGHSFKATLQTFSALSSIAFFALGVFFYKLAKKHTATLTPEITSSLACLKLIEKFQECTEANPLNEDDVYGVKTCFLLKIKSPKHLRIDTEYLKSDQIQSLLRGALEKGYILYFSTHGLPLNSSAHYFADYNVMLCENRGDRLTKRLEVFRTASHFLKSVLEDTQLLNIALVNQQLAALAWLVSYGKKVEALSPPLTIDMNNPKTLIVNSHFEEVIADQAILKSLAPHFDCIKINTDLIWKCKASNGGSYKLAKECQKKGDDQAFRELFDESIRSKLEFFKSDVLFQSVPPSLVSF